MAQELHIFILPRKHKQFEARRDFAPSWALAASLGEAYPRHPGSGERENSQASGARGQEGAML